MLKQSQLQKGGKKNMLPQSWLFSVSVIGSMREHLRLHEII